MSFKGSTAKITNTSGGDLLIAGKSAILHFNAVIAPGSDTERLEAEDPLIWFAINYGAAGISGPWDPINQDLIAFTLFQGTPAGPRTFAVSLGFYGDQWTELDNRIELEIDVVKLEPRTLLFYPVITDESQRQRERAWLESLVMHEGGMKAQIERSMPVIIGEYRVERAVLVDSTLVAPDHGRDLAFLALNELPYVPGIRTQFHIAILSPEIHKGAGRFVGYAGRGRTSAFNWSDSMREGTMVVERQLGHNMGLSHVQCPGTGHYNPIYPDSDGRLDFDAYEIREYNASSPYVRKKELHYDFMAYCHPNWVSSYSYERMIDFQLGR